MLHPSRCGWHQSRQCDHHEFTAGVSEVRPRRCRRHITRCSSNTTPGPDTLLDKMTSIREQIAALKTKNEELQRNLLKTLSGTDNLADFAAKQQQQQQERTANALTIPPPVQLEPPQTLPVYQDDTASNISSIMIPRPGSPKPAKQPSPQPQTTQQPQSADQLIEQLQQRIQAQNQHTARLLSHKPQVAKQEQTLPESERLSVVFVSAEVAPWSKTGGLGDVIGSLPKSIAALGHRVMVVTPRYFSSETEKRYEGLNDLGVSKCIDLGNGGLHYVSFFHKHADHVDWVFVDHISYHRPGNPYGSAQGGVYADNLFRFALLSMAAIEATLILPIGGYRYDNKPGDPYGQQCLFIANDWHTSLLPVYVAARMRPYGVHTQSRCVLALHNLAHQGSFPPSNFPSLGLDGAWYNTLEWVVNAGSGGSQGQTHIERTINILKAGVVSSDSVITVSQAYASEICYEESQGAGLSSLLAQRSDILRGIVNGIDVSEWDPATDRHLAYKYTLRTIKRKMMCKTFLQHELGLPEDPQRPLLGFIGRLDYQKGPDLVLKGLEQMVNMDCQVVILGSGAADYEAQVKQAQQDYPYHVRGITQFNVPLAHRIIAGCDILLMPSRFEPCGLNQLYAMRYGTIPIAHSTGGLRDTIMDYNEFAEKGSSDRGTGWTFSPATLDAFIDAVSAAVEIYKEEPQEWQLMQRRCMDQDFSWDSAARQYTTVFKSVMLEEMETQASKESKGAAALQKQTQVLKQQAEEAVKKAALLAAQEAARKAEEAARKKRREEAARNAIPPDPMDAVDLATANRNLIKQAA